MQKIYPQTDPKAFSPTNACGYMLWKDFEKALGRNEDLSKLHHLICEDEVADFSSLPLKSQQTIGAEKVKETLNKICPLLKEWAESFADKYKDVKKRLPLGENSKYITFNYTRVLEEVYGIEGEEHVWHIHGSVCDDNVITGYDTNLFSTTIYGSPLEEASERNIRQELENMRKPTEDVYQHLPDAFKDMNGIKTIIVIGHSLADVDIPYLRYMLDSLPAYSNIKWQYWLHNEEAKKEAQEKIGNLRNEPVFEDRMTEESWDYHIMDDWKEIERQQKERNKNIIFE